MESVAKKVNSLVTIILVALLSVLGFSSCRRRGFASVYGGPPEDYNHTSAQEDEAYQSAGKEETSEKVSEYRDLFYEEYDKKNYTKAEEYCMLGAQEGDSACESWMGWWAFNDLNFEESVRWYRRSVSHGNIHALHSLGNVYAYMCDYEEARKCYEEAIAAGDDLEDSLEALQVLPKAGDYEALCKYALNDMMRGPDCAVALKYALKGGLTKPDAADKLEGIIFACENPLPDGEDLMAETAALTLSNMAAGQISADQSKNETYRLETCIDTYLEYERTGDETAKNVVQILKRNGIIK